MVVVGVVVALFGLIPRAVALAWIVFAHAVVVGLLLRDPGVVLLGLLHLDERDHLRVRDDIQKRIGPPLYGTAYLEEPLEVSTSTFQWVEASDPFSYVGPH